MIDPVLTTAQAKALIKICTNPWYANWWDPEEGGKCPINTHSLRALRRLGLVYSLSEAGSLSSLRLTDEGRRIANKLVAQTDPMNQT